MSNEATRLADELVGRDLDKQKIEQNAKRLIELLPSLTIDEMNGIVRKIESLHSDEPLWKKEIAGNIVEVALTKRPIPDNPLSVGIRHLYEQLVVLNLTGIGFFSSIIQVAVLVPLLIVFVIVWPYGLVPVAARTIWRIILVSRAKIRFKTRGIMEKMPLTLAIGVYFLLWLPLAVLCLPFVVIGWIGTLISGSS